MGYFSGSQIVLPYIPAKVDPLTMRDGSTMGGPIDETLWFLNVCSTVVEKVKVSLIMNERTGGERII